MSIIVTGASGRMGRALLSLILDHEDLTLGGALVREGSPLCGQDAASLVGRSSSGVTISDDLVEMACKATGMIDFTLPEALFFHAEMAAQERIPLVVGTTGLSDRHIKALEAAAAHCPIVYSGNTSLGVTLLMALVEKAAAALGDDFDIEILEMHHKHKVDAPSGTALMLGQAAASGRDISLDDQAVYQRVGHTGERYQGSIGFATLRGGSVIGEHDVIFAGEGERIILSHRANDRAIFARGALRALSWAQGKKPGLYSIRDVLGL